MKAWELLDSPEKWIKGEIAKDELGNSLTYGTCKEACQWCLLGSLQRCYGEDRAYFISAKIRRELKIISTTEWNDAPERTYEEVHGLLKELDI